MDTKNEHTPSEKSPEMEQFLENMFGRTSSIEGGTCVFCKQAITEFRDSLSEKEYTISGMCQQCQDDVFGS